MKPIRLAAIVCVVCLLALGSFLFRDLHERPTVRLDKRVRFSSEPPDVFTFEHIPGERTLNVSQELQAQYDMFNAHPA